MSKVDICIATNRHNDNSAKIFSKRSGLFLYKAINSMPNTIFVTPAYMSLQS